MLCVLLVDFGRWTSRRESLSLVLFDSRRVLIRRQTVEALARIAIRIIPSRRFIQSRRSYRRQRVFSQPTWLTTVLFESRWLWKELTLFGARLLTTARVPFVDRRTHRMKHSRSLSLHFKTNSIRWVCFTLNRRRGSTGDISVNTVKINVCCAKIAFVRRCVCSVDLKKPERLLRTDRVSCLGYVKIANAGNENAFLHF